MKPPAPPPQQASSTRPARRRRRGPGALLNASVMERLREQVRVFRSGSPGSRFQELYRQRRRSDRGRARKLLVIGVGVLFVVAGIVSFPVPGPPSILITLLGVGLVAQEWMRAARALDWIELRLQRPYRQAAAVWVRLPLVLKAAVVAVAVGALVASAYAIDRILLGGQAALRLRLLRFGR